MKKAPAARVGAIFKDLVTTIKDSRNCLRRLQGRVVIDEGDDGFKSLALHRFRRLQTELHSLCISSRAACEQVEKLAEWSGVHRRCIGLEVCLYIVLC